MAAIPGFTEAQNQALAGLVVGDIIVVYKEESDEEDQDDASKQDDNASTEDCDSEQEDVELTPSSVPNAMYFAAPTHASNGAALRHPLHQHEGSPPPAATAATIVLQAATQALTAPDPGLIPPNLATEVQDQQMDEAGNHADDGAASAFQDDKAHMYVLSNITTNATGIITDATAMKVLHRSDPASSAPYIYDFFGLDCVHQLSTQELAPHAHVNTALDGKDADLAALTARSLASLEDGFPSGDFTICPKPDATFVLDHLFDGRYPCDCHQGYLSHLGELIGRIPNYTVPTSHPHMPLCPHCMGIALCQEHQSLRVILETFTQVDIGAVVDFYGRMNPRRRQLGYPFVQFDERDWGYMFDDMLSEDESEDGGSTGNDGFQHWAEALDPNAEVAKRPASATTIAALPKKKFAEVSKRETECVVCKDAFMNDSAVVVLGCGHYFCAGGCVEKWLRQCDSCPTCRAKVAAVEKGNAGSTGPGEKALPQRAAIA